MIKNFHFCKGNPLLGTLFEECDHMPKTDFIFLIKKINKKVQQKEQNGQW